MPNKDIFCNVPWTNLHIYWDGSYGVCCSETGKPYAENLNKKYNISTMSIPEWFASEPMKNIRLKMFGDDRVNICSNCYYQESINYESRRVKENFKSVIFTEQGFDRSYKQSPTHNQFELSKQNGSTDILPIDWHVDLGNECNLACKMCFPRASSKIAAQYRRWNIIDVDQPIFNNWTDIDNTWQQFLDGILQTPNLNRIHFMGGEPLLNKRFEGLLDFLLLNKKDISISFVTNGTIYKQSIIDRLLQFKNCDLEISIESFDKTNDYIRQGSSIEQTVKNIKQINDQTNDKFKLVLRSVPQLLNVNSYHNFIEWCLANRVPVQGIPLKNPSYLKISVLPWNIRQQLIEKYQNIKNKLERSVNEKFNSLTTGRDISNLEQQLLRETNAVINSLNAESDLDVDYQRQQLANWLFKWDQEYKFNAVEYYPEYADFFTSIGYGKI
jgi:molybdenum cofactor biosynthesis enzyme MoaA